jgi:glycosyltransferase involved in cell wall biosynthesis
VSGYRILYHHRIRADDGQAVHVRELIGALRELGHEVRECALVPKAGRVRDEGRAGGFWRRLWLPRVATELLEIGYSRRGEQMLVEAAAEFRPDVVYERHALHCDAGLRAARRIGVPLLLEVNSPLVDEMHALGVLRFAGRARRTEREVLAGADRIFAVTAVLRDILLERGADPERTTVIANGADPRRYDSPTVAAGAKIRAGLAPPDAFVLGFVGFARAWHRLDLAVDALARPELAPVHLAIVGEGPALDEVAARARACGVADRVHFLGRCDPDQLPRHVVAFDAALIPAINRYASPLKLFDSLAAGVPTVAPRQPNLEEVVTDRQQVVLFEPSNVDSLAAAIGELVADRSHAAAIGAAGRARLDSADLTWLGAARRVVEAFESIQRSGESVPA